MADCHASGSRQPEKHGPEIDEADESVMIAIRALGDMRSQRMQETAPESSNTTSPGAPSSTVLPVESSHAEEDSTTTVASPGAQFVSRVSTLPLVNTAIRVYEHGKNSSRVVKYGAEMVESSIQSISRPVIERLPTNTLDEFACRQLDRLDRYRQPSGTGTEAPLLPPIKDVNSDQEDGVSRSFGTKSEIQRDNEGNHSPPRSSNGSQHLANGPDHSPHSDTLSNVAKPGTDVDPPHEAKPTNGDAAGDNQAVVQRSRWHTVLSEAGGLSAALSDESMKRLKYCLEWLLYATSHIDAQMLVLRDFIAQLQPIPPNSDSLTLSTQFEFSPSVSHMHLRTLNNVRRDIVHTIRQVVDVVSKYAGGALPEPARTRVRGFILKLPQRWASRASTTAPIGASIPSVPSAMASMPEDTGVPGGLDSVREGREGKEREREERQSVAAAGAGGAASRRSSRASKRLQQRERGAASESGASMTPSTSGATHRSHTTSPAHSRPTSPNNSAGGPPMTPGAAVVAAQRILTLATESLDMMRGVTGVLKDSLDRADAWVGRLRAVGIQRNGQGNIDDFGPGVPPLPISEEGETPPEAMNGTLTAQSTALASARRGSLPSVNPNQFTRSFGRPPSLSQSFASSSSYEGADVNNTHIPRHQSYTTLPPRELERREYAYDSQPHSATFSSGVSRSSVPSTPGSMFGSSQPTLPGTPAEGEIMHGGLSFDGRFRYGESDLDGEASRMSMMSLASRRGSLADLLLAVDAAEGISGGVGTQPLKQPLDSSRPIRNDSMDVDS
ncbi:hypothetical protein PC9H_006342 [Pleurotus ostreatus]|uniref:Opi1-domain-containing protein n=1 Tax=Pleurotus ostreatus TaxID=5322 RepID=A0A8H6ZWS4_PLEOS|nr:uncharacterized protein PC9H_006342 [Pleurotus ostreatus]KAF7430633.1 hypothetical protein PC9H_006342 [Pleurotus ostreatus]